MTLENKKDTQITNGALGIYAFAAILAETKSIPIIMYSTYECTQLVNLE
jgi:hypothetical protein